VFVESTLWGVIAYEPKPGVARLIDRAERSALRALARAFGAAIARERLAKAVAHQQKVDAVGRLALGVAQDFSQQLWPILLYTEMLERSPGLDDRARQVLGEMRVAARRASELVEQVLAISRQRDRLIDLVHVADIAIEVSHHVRNGAPNSFSITTSIDADSGCILGDPAQLRHVLLALGLSAIAAHRDRVDRSTPSALRMVVEQAAHDGRDFVRIACEFDNTLADFVTGALVRGEETGELRRVIAEMGGTIALQDGATIEMLLPRVPTDAKTNAGVAGFAGFAVESSGVSSDRSALGSEAARPVSTSAPVTTALEALPKVLFVDDDAAVLEVVREVLDSLGYAVTACRDASAALAQLSSGWLPDIVLTDLTMPGMNGIELAREIRKRGFEMPIVCCTGFLDEASERAGAQAGMCAFVRKPVDCDALDQTLRTAIEKERRLRRRG
jgi:CheY-like chemotaxis protein